MKIDQEGYLNVDESKLDKINIFLCTEFSTVCSMRIKTNIKSNANDLK